MTFRVPNTPGGYGSYEVTSALQKAVRRGQEEEALYWALELIAVAKAICLKRLRVIALEDIGLADPTAVAHALSAIDLCATWHQKDGGSGWRIALANAVLVLCRAEKSRLADNFQRAVRARKDEGWHPDIPDEALDKHTKRGKAMGRGFAHFVEVSTHLENETTSVPDQYRERAEAAWIAEDSAPKSKGGATPPDQHDLLAALDNV